MTDFDIAAPLAAALAAKGYSALTSVQAAILTPEAKGRDLLVSAQTGSGKTVAFGLALSDQILPDQPPLLPAEQPLALVIAPTRELALQVARELDWLYAEAGARIATCVGGMDYRTERRALERGPHIVVGTPGRLRDHTERGSLDLSGLRVAVLDEADEMLDLGFREDLEFLLQSAPEGRRTLMFSATVPPEIEALAKDFQRDALRLSVMGEARQHGDIEYRALSVLPRDRENAIFNLLRFYEAQRAIIFCKTRANVNHLLARMGNRGFRVVALSGELSQQERTHALQSLRDGRARVCIATDVAARGIDLPGLELVIHADLPTNPETLLHRSGRTGRAGAKGVSALIVTSADYKRAQRLLQRAKLTAEWGKPPSADDVLARDDARMLAHPSLTEPAEETTLAAELLRQFGPDRVAQAFIRLWRDGRPAPEELAETAAPAPGPAAPRERREFGAAVWFTLSVGHTGRAEARWLLPKLCEAGGINRDAIGAIRVRQDVTFVQIAADSAPRFTDGQEIEPGLRLNRIEGEPDLDRPAPRQYEAQRSEARPRDDHRARPERPKKPAATEPAPRKAERREARAAAIAEVLADTPRESPAEPAPSEAKPRKARWSAADRKSRGAATDKPRGKPAHGKTAHGKGTQGKGAEARPRRAVSAKPGGVKPRAPKSPRR
ncbi:DEAD/DEAH box helicase [Paracoccus siganidrum]|nr:DEAD/DEAH box helicase [Paracoccus siganidrum]RMC39432.1 DEAD/DEAH box helicase [Paracoccus siganidrum]